MDDFALKIAGSFFMPVSLESSVVARVLQWTGRVLGKR